jgi:pyruvate/2-oxoglutarate dehydrogenase complex dihydrolipoamide dehydrogenase (E3) component
MNTTHNSPSGQNGKVEEYDLVILGGGTGGTVAAWTFASEGVHCLCCKRRCLHLSWLLASGSVPSQIRTVAWPYSQACLDSRQWQRRAPL